MCLKQRKYGVIMSVTDELINFGMKTVNQAWSKLYKCIWFTGPRIPFYDKYLSGPVFLSLFKIHILLLGFPGGSDSKESACSAGEQGSIPESWRRAWQPTPVFLPGESHGQRSLAGYSP